MGKRRYFGNMDIDFDRLAPDVKEYVNAKVREGVYASIEEMLEQAITQMVRKKQEQQSRLIAAEASLIRGDGRTVTEESMRQLAEDVKQRGRARLAAEKELP